MGMYPGAQISYGIAVPDMEGWPEVGEFAWWTPEAEEEHYGDHEAAMKEWLKRADISGVHIGTYGHMGYGECGLYIYTEQIRVYSYDVRRLTKETLDIDPGDAPKLENAWHHLFGDLDHEKPSWIVTLTYG